ncbi:hypothetical protein ACKGJO_08185 [Gracilimonas sp. Q87]|uniref:hypothetical protein n=1 Tax=Gracilimonas sp. Q87 TaxID=3384766 RepID=UPI00398426DC
MEKHIDTIFEENLQVATTLYWIVILPGNTSSPTDVASSFSKLAAMASTTVSGESFRGGATANTAVGGASGGA